jgi:hypothetical protein
MSTSQESPRFNAVELPASDAISAVAAALLDHVTSSESRWQDFHAWYREATGDNTVTEGDLLRDLNAVKEALDNMGFHAP